MEKYIRLWEEHKVMLVKQHDEVMDNIRIITDAVKVSEDKEMRRIVAEMMRCANHIGSQISSTEYEIKRLQRKDSDF
jgi:Na+/phosphate symporter